MRLMADIIEMYEIIYSNRNVRNVFLLIIK